jgi:hypothetical protein
LWLRLFERIAPTPSDRHSDAGAHDRACDRNRDSRFVLGSSKDGWDQAPNRAQREAHKQSADVPPQVTDRSGDGVGGSRRQQKNDDRCDYREMHGIIPWLDAHDAPDTPMAESLSVPKPQTVSCVGQRAIVVIAIALIKGLNSGSCKTFAVIGPLTSLGGRERYSGLNAAARPGRRIATATA